MPRSYRVERLKKGVHCCLLRQLLESDGFGKRKRSRGTAPVEWPHSRGDLGVLRSRGLTLTYPIENSEGLRLLSGCLVGQRAFDCSIDPGCHGNIGCFGGAVYAWNEGFINFGAVHSFPLVELWKCSSPLKDIGSESATKE
jgi:hypothetical protein